MYQLHMPHWPKPVQEPPGTAAERTQVLLTKLGHPERHLPPVIHVGGTKGKGSTIAFLRAMLEAAGYDVHAYTSPHLARFNERIVLAGQDIDDANLYQTLEEVRLAAGDFPVGFFDATTAAAMLAFQRAPADILLMEMGLGGEVDATSVIDAPLLTIMTTISYDHTEFMGKTLPEIARFESGLFKPHVPAIVSYQTETVWETLRAEAAKTGAPLYEYGRHFQARARKDHMVFADSHGEVTLPLPALLGDHQVINAASAIAAVSALESFDVSPDNVVEGLLNAKWNGRLARMHAPFLSADSEVWFDGGHNAAAAEVIAHYVREHWQDKPFYLIFSTTRGKDVSSMLTPFAGLVREAYGVSVKSEPHSLSAAEATHALDLHFTASAAESIRDALDSIRQKESRPFRALIFGSLYFWLEASQLS